MKKRRRKTELSIFNVALCMIVVLIHLISKDAARIADFHESVLNIFFVIVLRLTSFVVQAFIFLSAVKTFLNGRKERYGTFLLKRIKTVVLPYIAATAAYYIYFSKYLEWFEPSFGDFLGYLARFDISAQFYFILVILQFYLLYPLWVYIIDNIRPVYVISAAAVITVVAGCYSPFIINSLFSVDSTPWRDSVFTTYLFYWVCGMYAGKYYQRAIRLIKRFGRTFITAAVIFAAADCAMVFMRNYAVIGPTNLDMVHALYCVSVIGGGMYISYLARHRMNIFMKVLDRSSFYIYLVHVLFINILDYSVEGFNIKSIGFDLIVRSLIIYAAVILFAWIYCFICQFITVYVSPHKRNSFSHNKAIK